MGMSYFKVKLRGEMRTSFIMFVMGLGWFSYMFILLENVDDHIHLPLIFMDTTMGGSH